MVCRSLLPVPSPPPESSAICLCSSSPPSDQRRRRQRLSSFLTTYITTFQHPGQYISSATLTPAFGPGHQHVARCLPSMAQASTHQTTSGQQHHSAQVQPIVLSKQRLYRLYLQCDRSTALQQAAAGRRNRRGRWERGRKPYVQQRHVDASRRNVCFRRHTIGFHCHSRLG